MENMVNNKELFGAFVKFNLEFQGSSKDGNNPFYRSKYITLDEILNTVRPILARNGLAIIQNAYGDMEGYTCVKTLLIHESGQYYETNELKMKPFKEDTPQERGKLITYMKRYSLSALIGVSEFDDDGNSASEGAPSVERAKKKNGVAANKSNKQQEQQQQPQEQPQDLINDDQLKKLWAITSGQVEVARSIIEKYGYSSSKEIEKKNFNKIIDEIDKALYS